MRVANGMPASVVGWTTVHVKEWLIRHDFTMYTHLLCDIHRIDGTALLMLTEDDLKSPPLNIEVNLNFKTRNSVTKSEGRQAI